MKSHVYIDLFEAFSLILGSEIPTWECYVGFLEVLSGALRCLRILYLL